MFMLLIEVDVRPELLDEFAHAIEANARASVEREADCLRFEVAQVTEKPARWIFLEAYTDEASWLRHRQSPHFLAYQAVAERALLTRAVTRLTPIVLATAS